MNAGDGVCREILAKYLEHIRFCGMCHLEQDDSCSIPCCEMQDDFNFFFEDVLYLVEAE